MTADLQAAIVKLACLGLSKSIGNALGQITGSFLILILPIYPRGHNFFFRVYKL